ncbi:MAG TPA: CDGSH iron-sulfur domain-containing protein [bacterium]|nr:CDGSH iron-sulfur domain-containing protein [bacterium]
MAEIKILPNGPYLVSGDDATLLDDQGQPIEPPRRPFALCRCGGSVNKPYCDGTHSRIGFQGAMGAVERSDQVGS